MCVNDQNLLKTKNRFCMKFKINLNLNISWGKIVLEGLIHHAI